MVGAVKTDDLIMEEYYMELSMQYGYSLSLCPPIHISCDELCALGG